LTTKGLTLTGKTERECYGERYKEKLEKTQPGRKLDPKVGGGGVFKKKNIWNSLFVTHTNRFGDK